MTVNWIGLWNFYLKEVHRFMNVALQTILAPLVTAFLFFSIFTFAFDGATRVVGTTSYQSFLASGLIMMTMMQNAFANSSSSLLHSKMMGNIGDVLMPPLASWEITCAYLCGGLTRGMLVGMILLIFFSFFVSIPWVNGWMVLFYGFHACLFMTSLGLIAAICAQKFDHMASLSNFIITPLTFLAGTFYSVSKLPPPWLYVATFNPFYYLIDGFRAGLIGHSEGGIIMGLFVVAITAWGTALLAWWMIDTGYRLLQ